ncbi:MAG: hypothetical protein IT210_26665 [Armatimonadetes bacterium]|nr:hypothetical protein [Armatimonadota bacterium]
MTVAMVATTFSAGNQELSHIYLTEHGYRRRMLSKSRLNRHLHAIPEATWQGVLAQLSQVHQQKNTEQVYLVDSFPVAVCDNYRISRYRLYQCEAFRGKIECFFYGLRVHLLVTQPASRCRWC